MIPVYVWHVTDTQQLYVEGRVEGKREEKKENAMPWSLWYRIETVH